MTERLGGSITRDGDMAVIRVPLSRIHEFRVSLQPCPCKGAKSHSTSAIRESIDKGLGRLQAGMART